ncbi:MAG: T9SS type A sorting domain-containing protein [Bacteroidales bacterium]|nr:T9SS type A sorting domain-containing protein [Bacteroidales bacterium]
MMPLQNGNLYYDTTINKYTIMPDTLFINDSLFSIIDNPDSLAYTGFQHNDLYAACALTPYTYKQKIVVEPIEIVHGQVVSPPKSGWKISFKLCSNLYITNKDSNLPKIKINFDDGNGYIDVSWDSIVFVKYIDSINAVKEKNIKIKFSDINSEMVIGFPVKLVNAVLPDTVIYSTDLGFTCPISDPNPSFLAGQAMVSIKYADAIEKKLRKPLILVEGFEGALEDYGIIHYTGVASGHILNANGEAAYDWLNELHLVYDTLHNHGYDIIHVDFKDPRTYIQNNGLALVKIIQYVDSMLIVNNSSEKLVVIGASMGGLISRYAIRMMELQGCCHNVRLWATFDSPHKGANIPVGTQRFVKSMREVYDKTPIFKGKFEDAKNGYEKVLCSPAAEQMLIYHLENDATLLHNNFYSFLDSIGLPENCRRIAISNGNETGIGFQGMDASKRLVGINWRLSAPYHYNTNINPIYDFPEFKKKDIWAVVGYSESNSYYFKNNTFNGALISYNAATGLAFTTTSSLLALDAGTVVSLISLSPVSAVTAQAAKYGIKTVVNPPLNFLYNIGQNHFTNTSSPYSICFTEAPGSMSDTQKGMDGFPVKAFTENHTFMPTPTTLNMPLSFAYSNIRSLYLADQSISPFDAYWACDRIEGYPQEVNMMHVECNLDNREWIKDHILADWELRDDVTGLYKGTLTSYYNYGRPRPGLNEDDIIMVNKPYQTILYSLDIENNGQLFVNKQDVIGLSNSTLYPRPGSTFRLKTNCEPCDSTIVRIKDGGKFVIGEENNGYLNKGEVHFCKNSTLEIFGNGYLIVRDSSRLIIEEGANLIIHPGAIVLLEGSASILELKGKVIIKDHAALAPQGDGFIRFAAKMNANNISDYWQVGFASSLVFASNSTNQTKKGEVVENTYLPDNLNQYFINTIIELDSMVTLSSYGSIQAQYSKFIAIDSNKFYNAVKVYGQPNIRFGSCEFRNGNYGLSAQMSYGGSTFALDTCTFTKNYIGLYTSDEYIFINKCDFIENLDYGWKAENMQSNCDVTNSVFDDNGYAGAYFNGQGNVTLNVNWSKFRNNYQHGMEISEATLNSSCSKYQSNGQSGIFAKENAELDLSGNKMNQITNNYTGVLLDKALTLNIEHGFNNFTGNQYFIVGEVKPDNYYLGMNNTAPLNLQYNLLPAPSAMQMPINVYLYDPTYNNQFILGLDNWTQNLSSFETYCIGSPIPPNFYNYQMFEGKISTAVISTAHFQNTYLMDAFKSAAMQMSYGIDYMGNDTLSIALFKEIFDNIPASVNDDEHNAIDDALNLMISALTYAIEYELIDPNRALDGMPVDEYVAMIADEIQNRLNDIEYANLYAEEQEAYYQLLLAQMYRAAEHYDYALAILQNDNYFFNTTLKNQADYWNCVCMAENLLLKDSIERSEYNMRIDSCHAMSAAKLTSFHPIFGTNSVNLDESNNQLIAIYPNPAEQLIAVEFSERIEDASVELMDISGKGIWSTHQIVKGKQIRLKLPQLNSGTYLLKIITNNEVYNNKVIIK